MTEHKIERHLVEVVIYPDHAARVESPEFTANRARLVADGHGHCFVCQSTEHLECHHYGCEYSLWNDCDADKLKAFLEKLDIYGYGRLLQHQPIASVDDIRNLVMLCHCHHVAPGTGIHETTLPIWELQALCKAGCDPVPKEGGTS